ncbi:MAG: DUF1579 domain-containing protein, partial [Pirellulaceae bacterium]|nr:DUF1579 domain-containing protein [Pirellulaceae bacterium]
MFAAPQTEHEWFHALLGEWKFTHQCVTGPDQPPVEATGTLTARTLGGLWTILECRGESPEGQPWTSLFTLGFDPTQNRYVGTFVASMMTHLWLYQGQLDETGKRLVLDVEGPRFDGQGMAQYQDIFEIVDL